ncbi:hypothetical protein SUGI_0914590 [Cryptomeria japonica]|nr:hypothetical protein SUGI_0914590 [Cryptomeria japonica]
MAVPRCGKELKQAFDAMYKGAFQRVFHYFKNRSCYSTLNKAERSAAEHYAFKRASGKEGTSSGRLFIPTFGIQGRSTIKHGFWSCGMRNVGQGRRFYYVGRDNLQHFKRRGPQSWIKNPTRVVIIVILSSGLAISIYFSNLEIVPYTHRKHFILLPAGKEKELGESQIQELKKTMKSKILPAIHPESVRVRLIAKDIIQALQRGIRHEQSWSDVQYGNTRTDVVDSPRSQDPWSITDENAYPPEQLYGKDEALDDKWVKESRESGKQSGEKVSTHHLEGLNWEVLVVDDDVVNAFCLPGGKIMVFTGLLKVFPSDAEIATVISHEVGHCVARHAAEGLTSNLWFTIIQLIVLQFIGMPDVVNAMSTLFLRLPFSRRMEMEADYIGLLLMASAGYDPRIAPSVYEKLGQLGGGDSMIKNYLSTHPSGKKRGEMLRQAKGESEDETYEGEDEDNEEWLVFGEVSNLFVDDADNSLSVVAKDIE